MDTITDFEKKKEVKFRKSENSCSSEEVKNAQDVTIFNFKNLIIMLYWYHGSFPQG
jgi:hypothetical protein